MKKIVKAIISSFISEDVKDIVRIVRFHRHQKNRELMLSKKNTQVIQSLLQKTDPIYLELGADKPRSREWVTVDLNDQCDLHLNLTQPLPFPDNCVDRIYSSHVLEHFHYPDLMNLLSECYRILKLECSFEVAVPNAQIYLDAYSKPLDFDWKKFCCYEPAFQYHSKIDYVNYIAYMAGHHRYMFDTENLVEILTKAGFRKASLREFDSTIDLEVRKYESIYAIGIK